MQWQISDFEAILEEHGIIYDVRPNLDLGNLVSTWHALRKHRDYLLSLLERTTKVWAIH
jgi:hypothetical protein